MSIFLGIDAGTTSLKAALFDQQGHMLAIDRQEYTLLTPSPAQVEAEPEVYWQALCSTVRNVLLQSGINPNDVKTLCISSQGETFIPLGSNGQPLRRAIVWLDNRATEEAAQILKQFGTEEVFHRTGQPDVAPTWPACKILWLQHKEPEIFNNTSKYAMLEDYLIYRLTDQFVTERAQMTSSLLLDIQKKTWWPEILECIGINSSQLGNLLDPGEPVAHLTPQAAQALGLSTTTMAVSGSMDQAIGAVGAGNIRPGMVAESTGGALGIIITLDAPFFDPQHHIPCYFHAVPDTYCLLPWGQTAGMALKWFRDQFFPLEAKAALAQGEDPYDMMTQIAESVPPGCDGLVTLPHLEGAFCPEFNSAAKAVFFGASLRHTRAHFTRSILESVAFMVKKNLDLVSQMDIPVNQIRCMGGGARSRLWLQIKADVLQTPISTLEVEETACLGTAILGAVASGSYSSLDEAVKQMVHVKETIHPDPTQAAVYLERYQQYNELYDRLKPMFR